MAHHDEEDFKEMELWEHLQELRTRLIRSVCYLALGLCIAWAVYKPLNDLFFAPLLPILKQVGGRIVYTNFTQGFNSIRVSATDLMNRFTLSLRQSPRSVNPLGSAAIVASSL